MISDKCGKRLNNYVPDYVVFDLETTGVSWKYDGVVEISGIKVSGGEVKEEFSTLVNPGMPISPQASMVNGITDDMVADAPSFEVVFKDFMEFAGEYVLVGHNIHCFDMKYLYRDANKYWGKTVDNDYVDTLYLSRAYLPHLPHHKLVDLAAYYGIDTAGAHRALADCVMNQQVFENLGKEEASPLANVRKCPRCGNALIKRRGKFGTFMGCMGYPDCTYTENVRQR